MPDLGAGDLAVEVALDALRQGAPPRGRSARTRAPRRWPRRGAGRGSTRRCPGGTPGRGVPCKGSGCPAGASGPARRAGATRPRSGRAPPGRERGTRSRASGGRGSARRARAPRPRPSARRRRDREGRRRSRRGPPRSSREAWTISSRTERQPPLTAGRIATSQSFGRRVARPEASRMLSSPTKMLMCGRTWPRSSRTRSRDPGVERRELREGLGHRRRAREADAASPAREGLQRARDQDLDGHQAARRARPADRAAAPRAKRASGDHGRLDADDGREPFAHELPATAPSRARRRACRSACRSRRPPDRGRRRPWRRARPSRRRPSAAGRGSSPPTSRRRSSCGRRGACPPACSGTRRSGAAR